MGLRLVSKSREATSVSSSGQLLRIGAKGDDLDEALDQKEREKYGTVQGDRFPMPDAKHAKLALQLLPTAHNLSPDDKKKIKARAQSILSGKETPKPKKTAESRRERLTVFPRLIEAATYDEATRTADVIIIEEGTGNSRDKHYYGPDTIQQAALDKVFEGAQAYADHPGLDEDINRPERSVRDLFGYYFDTKIVEVQRNGVSKHALAAKLKIQEGADWAIGLIKEALSYSKQFPDKVYVGISINADGDVSPADMNGQQVNYVHRITEAFSADMVTKPARGGKFLALVESASGATITHRKGEAVDKKLLESAARLQAQIESGEIDKDDLVAHLALIESEGKDGDLKEKKSDAKKSDAKDSDAKESEPDGDTGDPDEDDGAEGNADAAAVEKKGKAKESVRESESDLAKAYPTLYARALKEAQSKVTGDLTALQQENAELKAGQSMRESIDLAQRKLTESKLPAAAAAKLLESLVGKDEAEMDRLIEAESEYLNLIGFKSKTVAGNGEKTVAVRESDAKANSSFILAGLGE